jgi:hypothetical protein
VIGTTTIKAKRAIQWDRSQIRVPRRGSDPWKKEDLKMIGIIVIREKR